MDSFLLILLCGLLFLTNLIFVWLFIKQKKLTLLHSRHERQWKTLAENIPDILIRVNAKMLIEYINPASSTFLKESPQNYWAKSIQVFLKQEKISGIGIEDLKEIFNTGEQLVKEISSGSKSEKQHLEFRFIPEIDDRDRIKNLLIIGRNISDRKNTEEKLREAKVHAEDSDRLKSAFLANMSHEIRTPLNAIVGFSNIILEDDLSSIEKGKYFGYINQNSNQLIALINDIIDISKIESKQLKIQEGVFNLNQHLREIEEIINHEKQNRDKNHLLIFLETELSDSMSEFSSDPYRLRQILINLLVNAVKFTPKGFIQFGYRVLEDQKILFYVRDSGVGISQEDHKLIFQHFRQLDNTLTRRHGGTGLGLAISENLVKLLGGKLWLQSDLGKGTTFYFTIPAKGLSNSKATN